MPGPYVYYKGMVAVHLENGVVTTREIPLPTVRKASRYCAS